MRRTGMRRMLLGLAVTGLCLLAPPVRADEISEQIEEGLKNYKDGNYGEAIAALNFAVTQMQQKKAESLTAACPKALKGWTATEAQSDAAGAAMFGGMTSVSCGYSKDPAKTPAGAEALDEPATIRISIVADSPMLQAALMMINNPALVGQGGGKPVKILAYRGVQTFSPGEQSGEVSLVVRSQMLVKVEGEHIANLDEVLAYAKAINFKVLEDSIGK